jgi:hypothetical protein
MARASPAAKSPVAFAAAAVAVAVAAMAGVRANPNLAAAAKLPKRINEKGPKGPFLLSNFRFR